jgi:hypothetical protein
MVYNINPTKEVIRVSKLAQKDDDFKKEFIAAEPSEIKMFNRNIDDIDKILLHAIYSGWILAKKGVDKYKEI